MGKIKINATELKVRVAAAATFVATLAGWVLLESDAVTDLVHRLPDPVQPVGAAFVLAGVAWFSGRVKRNKPEYISDSTIEAVRERLARQGKELHDGR